MLIGAPGLGVHPTEPRSGPLGEPTGGPDGLRGGGGLAGSRAWLACSGKATLARTITEGYSARSVVLRANDDAVLPDVPTQDVRSPGPDAGVSCRRRPTGLPGARLAGRGPRSGRAAQNAPRPGSR